MDVNGVYKPIYNWGGLHTVNSGFPIAKIILIIHLSNPGVWWKKQLRRIATDQFPETPVDVSPIAIR